MLRKALICALFAMAAAVLLAPIASAETFDPATQSHEGACARETTSVPEAVHDYAANGVLRDFAGLVGIRGSGGALAKAMRRQLVVARVRRRVVTANHGCDGEGHWFPVGPRTLNAGEQVGIAVPVKLRSRLCLASHRGCRRIVVKEATVFPITCWNPNFGRVSVVLYVHRRKPKPKRHVKPAKERAKPKPVTPAPAPPPAPPAPLVADPTASATQASCGEVSVTLTNAASATAPASFSVDGKSYGPLEPGKSETVTIPLTAGTLTTVQVTSGSSTLVDQNFSYTCKAEPQARVTSEQCHYSQEGAVVEVTVELLDAATATLPTSPFQIEWTNESEEEKTAEYRSLAPGEHEVVTLQVIAAPSTVKVTSGGFQFEQEVIRELPPPCNLA